MIICPLFFNTQIIICPLFFNTQMIICPLFLRRRGSHDAQTFQAAYAAHRFATIRPAKPSDKQHELVCLLITMRQRRVIHRHQQPPRRAAGSASGGQRREIHAQPSGAGNADCGVLFRPPRSEQAGMGVKTHDGSAKARIVGNRARGGGWHSGSLKTVRNKIPLAI